MPDWVPIQHLLIWSPCLGSGGVVTQQKSSASGFYQSIKPSSTNQGRITMPVHSAGRKIFSYADFLSPGLKGKDTGGVCESVGGEGRCTLMKKTPWAGGFKMSLKKSLRDLVKRIGKTLKLQCSLWSSPTCDSWLSEEDVENEEKCLHLTLKYVGHSVHDGGDLICQHIQSNHNKSSCLYRLSLVLLMSEVKMSSASHFPFFLTKTHVLVNGFSLSCTWT